MRAATVAAHALCANHRRQAITCQIAFPYQAILLGYRFLIVYFESFGILAAFNALGEKGVSTDSNEFLDRRQFVEMLTALGVASLSGTAIVWGDERSTAKHVGSHIPGRIENEYTLFLLGEREALSTPPMVSAITQDQVTVHSGSQSLAMHLNDWLSGWRLLAIVQLKGVETAVFEAGNG